MNAAAKDRRAGAQARGKAALLLLCSLYVLAIAAGMALIPLATGVAAFWPAAGVLAGGLAILAPRERKWLLAFAFLVVFASSFNAAAPERAIIYGAANLICGLVFLVGFGLLGPRQLREPTDMLRFVASAFIACAAGALLGTLGLSLLRDGSVSALGAPFWFLADFAGVIAVATPIIVGADRAVWRRPTSEIAIVVGVGSAVTIVAFLPMFGPSWPQVTPLAVATPFVLWCAARGSLFANTLFALILTTIAIVAISGHLYDYEAARLPLPDLIFATQLFILRVSGAALLLSILFEDRRRRESQLCTIIDTVPVGLIMADAGGRVLSVNAQVEALLRHKVPSAEGGAPHAHLPWQRLVEAEEGTQPIDVEYGRGDGSQAWLRLMGRPVRDGDGRRIGSVVAIVDVDEERKAWDRLMAEMETLQSRLIHVSRVSAMGTMASAIAHEVNQPLASIANYLRGARRMAQKLPGEASQIQAAIGRAEACAIRAGEIIMRLRKMINRETIATQKVPVAELIDASVSMALMGKRIKGVRCTRRSAPDACVTADPIQIQQVLINLITNGLEAAAVRQPGEVIVAAEIEQRMVRISVTDSGPGFAPEVADRLFEPFVSTKAEGLGVGLSICRTIVESHGGKIEVDEDKDRRTRVSITLPIAAAGAQGLDQAA